LVGGKLAGHLPHGANARVDTEKQSGVVREIDELFLGVRRQGGALLCGLERDLS